MCKFENLQSLFVEISGKSYEFRKCVQILKCVSFFYTTLGHNIRHSNKCLMSRNSDAGRKARTFTLKHPVLLFNFRQHWNLLTNLSRTSPYHILFQSGQPIRSCSLRADRLMDRHKYVAKFSDVFLQLFFANSPNRMFIEPAVTSILIVAIQNITRRY